MLQDMLQKLALVWQVIMFLLQKLNNKIFHTAVFSCFFKCLLDATPKTYKPDKQALQNIDM